MWMRGVHRKSLPAFAVSKRLQLKIIDMPKQHTSGWQVPSSTVAFWVLPPSAGREGESRAVPAQAKGQRPPQTRRGKESSRTFPYRFDREKGNQGTRAPPLSLGVKVLAQSLAHLLADAFLLIHDASPSPPPKCTDWGQRVRSTERCASTAEPGSPAGPTLPRPCFPLPCPGKMRAVQSPCAPR